MACRLDGSHPAFDGIHALKGVFGVLEVAPYCLDELISRLSEDLQKRLKQKFPPLDFDSNAERAQAIKKEIDLVILPELELIDKLREVSFLEASDILTPDDFKHEIALEERIDATIDRLIKRLIQIKAMKRILGQQTSVDQFPIRFRCSAVKRREPGNDLANPSCRHGGHRMSGTGATQHVVRKITTIDWLSWRAARIAYHQAAPWLSFLPQSSASKRRSLAHKLSETRLEG
jgi:hypothetical protein